MLVELRKYLCLFMCLLYSSKALASINSLPGSSKDIFKTFSFFSTELNCGGSSRQRKVTVRNPAKQVTDCTYTIKPYSSKVCQLRIDFDMILAQPKVGDGNGHPKCIDDKLTINDIEICGSNMNQHIYVPYNVEKLSESVKIGIKTSDRMENPNLGAVIWSATITQIECPEKSFFSQYDKLLAPVGCLQYFAEPNGTIESFNYNQGNGPYFGNLNYAICIRRKANKQKLSLKTIFFELSQAAPAPAEGFDADCVPQVPTEGGSEDHITISEAVRTSANTMRASKFCGRSLKDSSLTVGASGPFVIQFYSDGQYDPATQVEKGFKFTYTVA